MKRVKTKHKNVNKKIDTKLRDEIITYVKKNLFPLYAALFITGTKDVLGISTEEVLKILKTTNRYAMWHEQKLININDIKKNIEKDLGQSLEELLRS